VNDASHDLKAARRSVALFGVYLLGLALVLIAAPNVLLGAFGMPATQEVWIRVVGMLVGFLGFYYVRHGRGADRAFLEMTIQVRLSVPAFFLAFVLFTGAPWQLLLFAAFDLVGLAWTWTSLRGSPRRLSAAARG
jgi:hypothetical protein